MELNGLKYPCIINNSSFMNFLFSIDKHLKPDNQLSCNWVDQVLELVRGVYNTGAVVYQATVDSNIMEAGGKHM